MSVQSFICEEEFCGKYREEISLDEAFFCPRHKRCLGHKLLIARPLPLPAPFWKTKVFLPLSVVLITLTAVLFGLLVQSGPQTPRTQPAAARVDLRLEIQSLVASAQNLLRLWEVKLIAQDTADTKWVNGQRVTDVGRTSSEALDRAKFTSLQQRQFSEIAQQKDREILAEISTYTEITKRVASFPTAAIDEVFDSLRQQKNGTFTSREELAIGLARRHALRQKDGRLELKQVYSDYEGVAFR